MSPADPLLAPLPSDLPPVEHAARIPAGFVAGGATAGIKASGNPDLALVAATGDDALCGCRLARTTT